MRRIEGKERQKNCYRYAVKKRVADDSHAHDAPVFAASIRPYEYFGACAAVRANLNSVLETMYRGRDGGENGIKIVARY